MDENIVSLLKAKDAWQYDNALETVQRVYNYYEFLDTKTLVSKKNEIGTLK